MCGLAGIVSNEISEEESESGVSSMTTETNVSETGGSTLKKADITEFVVDDNDTVKLEAGMKEIFTKARFEPVSGGRQVRRSWRKLKGEIVDSLESGGGIPEEVRWEIEDLLMEKNVSYVVFAYFDVGVPDKDAASSVLSMFLRYKYEIKGISIAKNVPSDKTLITSSVIPLFCKLKVA